MNYIDMRSYTARVVANTSLESAVDNNIQMNWEKFGSTGVAVTAVAGLLNYELNIKGVCRLAYLSGDVRVAPVIHELQKSFFYTSTLQIDPPFIPFYSPISGPSCVHLIACDHHDDPETLERAIHSLTESSYTISGIFIILAEESSSMAFMGIPVVPVLTKGDMVETIALNQLREKAFTP